MDKKTIWITGGSTGIGKALAIKFASKGWNVAVSARRAELLNELSDTDFKNLLLEHYTFLKRPVLIWEDQVFVGNSKKTIEEASNCIHG